MMNAGMAWRDEGWIKSTVDVDTDMSGKERPSRVGGPC